MTFIIRTGVDTDMPRLREVYRDSSLSNENDRGNLLAHSDLLELSKDGVREARTRVALDADSAIVGFSTLLVTGRTIELEDLFVDPSWMRRGVGRALVLDAVSIARARSFERLEVTANPHALSFYKSTGFVIAHEVETTFYSAPRMYRAVLP